MKKKIKKVGKKPMSNQKFGDPTPSRKELDQMLKKAMQGRNEQGYRSMGNNGPSKKGGK